MKRLPQPEANNGRPRGRGPRNVFDQAGLLRLFNHLAGRTLIGPVDGGDCVELVFEHDPNGGGGNLITIFTDGPRRGLVAFGGVCQEWIDGGYGKPPDEQATSDQRPCTRCAGTGKFGHLGECFACGGTGAA